MMRDPSRTRRLAAAAVVSVGLLALAGAGALWFAGTTAGVTLPLAAVLPVGLVGLAGWRRATATGRWRAAVNSYADRQLIARARKRVW
jgi:hypothetical protein